MGAYPNSSGTQAGALTQLIAIGALDAYLTENASYTFWKIRYSKHSPFAMETTVQPFQSSVQFGSEAMLTLQRSGDLVYSMYVMTKIPGIKACKTTETSGCRIGNSTRFGYACTPCDPCNEQNSAAYRTSKCGGANEHEISDAEAKAAWMSANYGGCGTTAECCEPPSDCPSDCCGVDTWAHWTNDVGHAIIQQARITIGGSTIDTLYGPLLYMWEELTGRANKRLCEMTGKRFNRSALYCDSQHSRFLWTPLPFWFTIHSGQALPLASLQFHGVQVHVNFEELRNLIVVSGPDVEVLNCESGGPIATNDLCAHLESIYVFLDTVERDKFSNTHFEVLCVQHQVHTQMQTSNNIRISLNWNHPIIEIIWAVRRQCNEKSNNWFNFSGIAGKDPVKFVQLLLNNQARFSQLPGQYFRLVQPYQHHTSLPDAYVYCYSFALFPESEAPSGTCNFSRIDHIDFLIELQDDLSKEQTTLLMYARNFNILRFREGLCGIAYAN